MSNKDSAPSVGIIGGGVIGAGWVARFLLHGWHVKVFDSNVQAPALIDKVLENARVAMPALADVAMPAEGQLSLCDSVKATVTDCLWIQESVPENLQLKTRVIAEIEQFAHNDAIIASSTSGFKPSELQQNSQIAHRIVVAHPFNPVYLLPLVELVTGVAEDKKVRQRAMTVLTSIGMKPLHVRHEIDAHLADRLLESVWREALWLIHDDIATTTEIDDAIRYGFGLRWAQMGLFETYRLAGGEAGMAHFIEQFGPTLKWPWSKLTDVPDLNEQLIQKIAAQSDAQSGHTSIRELERIRDRNLVGMMRALKERNWGAGAVLNEHDKRLSERSNLSVGGDGGYTISTSAPLRMLELTVLPAWIDYNGHMTEYRYAHVFSDTCDRLLLMIGMDAEYVKNVGSYYTAETHIMHRDEVTVNTLIYSTSQILKADDKRLHVFHCIHASSDHRLLASAEQMYLHVGRDTGKVCEASRSIIAQAQKIAHAHASLPLPEAQGRYVGQRKNE